MLSVEALSVSYGDRMVVSDVTFSIEAGRWLMIVGPNGAGKSTIINAITRGVPHSGRVRFDGTDIERFKPSQIAQKIGVLTQNHSVGYAYTVEDVIRLGRYAYRRGLFSPKPEQDTDRVEQALELTGLSSLRSQSILTLSGGERQRTFLAQVFAQDPKLMLLDEPANHLDLVYQKQIFELVREWIKQPGRAVVSVVHDLSLAKFYGTDAILLYKGERVAFGQVSEVLTPERLNDAYGIDVKSWMLSLLEQWK
jgi:iron complex transport system ATP-binding protein